MSNSHFVKNGNRFDVAPKESLDIRETLPVGTYTVKYDDFRNVFYYEVIDDLVTVPKVYGDTNRHADRIFNTFLNRPQSTGVLLSGEKGSGKTLLAKVLSAKARSEGIVTLVINQPHHGEAFNTFMQLLSQPSVVIFDEFEKVYNTNIQEQMLTLLDGVYPSKKLFILTSNDDNRINDLLINRPGRVFYHIEYAGLSSQFVREFAEDALNDKSQVEALVRAATMFDVLNFDMLKAIVDEMNRYGESVKDALEILNAQPDSRAFYDVRLSVGGQVLDPEQYQISPSRTDTNPLMQGEYSDIYSEDFVIMYRPGGKDDHLQVARYLDNTVGGWSYVRFSMSDLTDIDDKAGSMTFVNSDGDSVTYIRERRAGPTWRQAL